MPAGMRMRRRKSSVLQQADKQDKRPEDFFGELKEFCDLTSAHGFPRISAARENMGRAFWTLLLVTFIALFSWQGLGIIEKYQRNEKIVSVELRFEKMEFPAVTICNLNPYKNTLARTSEGVSNMLSEFDKAMSNAPGDSPDKQKATLLRARRHAGFEATDNSTSNLTTENSQNQPLIQAFSAPCQCLTLLSECIPMGAHVTHAQQHCICMYNSLSEQLWPCYASSQWFSTKCADCDTNTGTCTYPSPEQELLSSEIHKCHCQNISKLCTLEHRVVRSSENVTLSTTATPASSSTTQESPQQVELDLDNGRWLVQPIESVCECTGSSAQHCKPSLQPPTESDNRCVCVYDSQSSSLWPCAQMQLWEQRRCDQCSSHGYCAYPLESATEHSSTACLCQRLSYFCVALSNTPNEAALTDFLPKAWDLRRRAKRQLDLDFDMTTVGRKKFKKAITLPPAKEGEQTFEMYDPVRIKKRQSNALQPAYVACDCGYGVTDCRPNLQRRPETNDTLCLCFFNSADNNRVWPCYPTEMWHQRQCSRCVGIGSCDYVPDDVSHPGDMSCICVDLIRICLRIYQRTTPTYSPPPDGVVQNITSTTGSGGLPGLPPVGEILRLWEMTTTTLPPTTTGMDPLGFAGVTDKAAIVTQAKENLLFEVAKLNSSQKSAMSYTKSELFKNDFHLLIDPTFGNCYTFAPTNGSTRAERAGPSYGLRLEAFVNTFEYLPTTESSGVRLTVHPRDEQPFPDTVGYSAPTGTISSFGVHVKKMDRLPAPHGDCVSDGKNEDFIYLSKSYSVEACHRSCLQKFLVEWCGCGEPRYPAAVGSVNCDAADPVKRQCLKDAMTYATVNKETLDCVCRQPCEQLSYSVTYSASKWPASTSQLDNCPDYLNALQCLAYFRDQGLMVEIFMEQLNYEYLKETEAYGTTNLMSDFGGQLGLWMGISFITCAEFLVLALSVLTTFCRNRRKRRQSGSVARTGTAKSSLTQGDDEVFYTTREMNGRHKNLLLTPPPNPYD